MNPSEVWRYIERGREEDCWPCNSTSRDGGDHRQAYVDGKYQYVHRIVWELTFGKIPSGVLVLHRCHNAQCCNPLHLKLGDHSENLKDSYASGKRKSIAGKANGRARLTEESVIYIRNSSKSHAALARELNVGETAVLRVRQRKTWSHV